MCKSSMEMWAVLEDLAEILECIMSMLQEKQFVQRRELNISSAVLN